MRIYTNNFWQLGLISLIAISGTGLSFDNSVNASDILVDSVEQPLTVAQLPKGEKVRVAVLDFDFSAVSNPIYLSYFNGGARGVSDMLVNELVRSGGYTVIERSKIDSILQEQNFGASGRVSSDTAAEIGRLLGVETVIFGSVTQMDLEQKNQGGGAFGIGVSSDKTRAFVQLSVRMVNTTTGEILTVADGTGEASQGGGSVSVFGIGGGSSTRNEGKLMTEATKIAIEQVVDSIDNSSSNLAAASDNVKPAVEAIVADVAGDLVILNKGSADGYRQGTTVSIGRISKEIKDPETGEVIRRLTSEIGKIELTDVDAKSSVGKIVSGTNFQIGDIATVK